MGSVNLRHGSLPLFKRSDPLALSFTGSWTAAPHIRDETSPTANDTAPTDERLNASSSLATLPSRRWSPALHTALRPILEPMIGGDGAGSFALPSLRDTIAAGNANCDNQWTLDTADAPRQQDGVTQAYLAELSNAQINLKGLQRPADGQGWCPGHRRVRCSALAYFTTIVQSAKALQLCVDIQLPLHASAGDIDAPVQRALTVASP